MNIRSIQCPSCGSNLNVESVNQALIYCMYCGASVQLETNHNKGYDMELGHLEKELEEIKKEYAETEAYLKQNAEVDIPPRFRQESTVEYILKGLQAREFVTLEQAIFKCEEAMSRKDISDFYLP